MTPARLYQLLAKEWVTGWVTPNAGPTLPIGGHYLGNCVNLLALIVCYLISVRLMNRTHFRNLKSLQSHTCKTADGLVCAFIH